MPMTFQKEHILTVVPMFLSCGRPYSQGVPADGPLERSAAIRAPRRTGNSLNSVPQNENHFFFSFFLIKKIACVSDFLRLEI